MERRIYPTRFGQIHLRSNDGKGVPLILLQMSPRSGAIVIADEDFFAAATTALR